MANEKIEMTKEEWLTEGERRFGPDPMKWRFVCPSCKGVQMVEDFKGLVPAGTDAGVAYSNCIGRYDGIHGGVEILSGQSPCNYASGGLFNLNPVWVKAGDEIHRVFAFAEVG